MSTTPPRSPAPPVEPHQASSSLLPSAQPLLKTPERGSGAVRNVPGSTPCSRGSSVRTRQDGDPDRVDRYKRDEYDDYIREDLNSRVFVDFEVFMKSVLHVPDNWKSQWGSAIEVVKANRRFGACHDLYHKLCRTHNSEDTFYQPLAETANAVLEALPQSEFANTSEAQCYRVNDPKKLRGGVMDKSGLSPDLVVLHKGCWTEGENGLHWANPLHILEVKPYDNTLCDGMTIPRLTLDGIDPAVNHAAPHSPSRHKQKESSPLTTSATSSGSTSSKSKKRPAEGSQNRPPKKSKKKSKSLAKSVLVQKPAGGSDAKIEGEEDEVSSTSTTVEPGVQVDPTIQVCRYLLEMLSIPLLRSHATVGLVDRDRLQLYHANRSVILVSSAINFSEDDGLDKFIAVIIAFQCLSFKQNGILNSLVDGSVKLVQNKDVPEEKKEVRKDHQLKLPTSGPEEEKFVVTLGEVISRDPAIIGRSTVVLKARSDKWPNENLVIKVSYPGSNRVAENEFLTKAGEEAKKPEQGWAENHLPRVYYFEDVNPGKDSTLESVASLFREPKFATHEEHVYERRTLRIIIQEELHPLRSLTNARDIGQAFLDVACIHRWLYDKPGILHRDLSLRNIMCRIRAEMNVEGKREWKVYGVLMDFDLSSWTERLEGDYTRTSQQRTGTPPYMASELLKATNVTHMYRHDLESLFYIMLLVCGRYTLEDVEDGVTKEVTRKVVKRKGNLPYEEWFNQQNYRALGKDKESFISDVDPIDLSPPFKDFLEWLTIIRLRLSDGFLAQKEHTKREWREKYDGAPVVEPTSFDQETLGGQVTYYSTIIRPIHLLKGDLKGLEIRYHGQTTTPHSS